MKKLLSGLLICIAFAATGWGATQDFKGTVNGAVINQSVDTTASPSFPTVKLTGLADGSIPKHTSDAVGFENSSISVDAYGQVTMPNQPSFFATAAASQDNVTGDGTTYAIQWTEVYDQNADFATNVFTAPITGKYHFDVAVETTGNLTANNQFVLTLAIAGTSARSFIVRDYRSSTDPNIVPMSRSVSTVMMAGDTATVTCSVGGGTKVVDITAGTYTYFSGFLMH